MPLKFQNLISKFFGHLINFIPIKRNRISKINIDLCFKDLNQKERLIIYKKNSYVRYRLDGVNGWLWSNSSMTFDQWIGDWAKTETLYGQFYVLYDTPDTFSVPNYDSGGIVTANSEYRLRNFQPSNAILQDELNEFKNNMNFMALDDSFDFNAVLSDSQRDYLKEILIE